uniref:Uncharacterized protein n=1 Tax=Ochrobactrum sp. SJY1 TaxID=1526653 RepID=A0A075XAK0_9HYPH|nr:hypothetical protein [Ochrobactrum sp. SJY1]
MKVCHWRGDYASGVIVEACHALFRFIHSPQRTDGQPLLASCLAGSAAQDPL